MSAAQGNDRVQLRLSHRAPDAVTASQPQAPAGETFKSIPCRDGGQAENTECAGKGVSGIQGGEEMDGTGMEGFGSAARNHDRPKKLPETHMLKASGTESTAQFDFNVLKDGDTLSDHQIELGWKKNRLVVHGDVLRLQTALPTREYYPGNMLHSRECASEGLRASSHERMRRSKTPRRASCCEHGGVQIMSQKIWRGG